MGTVRSWNSFICLWNQKMYRFKM